MKVQCKGILISHPPPNLLFRNGILYEMSNITKQQKNIEGQKSQFCIYTSKENLVSLGSHRQDMNDAVFVLNSN